MLASLSDSLFRGKKMNTLLGTIITALVTDENDKFYFVQKDGVTFALSKEDVYKRQNLHGSSSCNELQCRSRK